MKCAPRVSVLFFPAQFVLHDIYQREYCRYAWAYVFRTSLRSSACGQIHTLCLPVEC